MLPSLVVLMRDAFGWSSAVLLLCLTCPDFEDTDEDRVFDQDSDLGRVPMLREELDCTLLELEPPNSRLRECRLR